MKTKILFLIAAILCSIFMNDVQAQLTASNTSSKSTATTIKSTVPEEVGMKKEVLENRVQSKVLLDIDSKSAELITDGIKAIDVTRQAILAIQNNDRTAAIDYIGRAIGKLETVALRNPKMKMVPVHRVVRTNDIDTDLGAIKVIKDNIYEALEQNKFHIARRELESLISEVSIETTNIPIGSYPAALRNALVSIENGKLDVASNSLNTLLNTLIVSKEHISLPTMRAEVMLEEALTIQPGHTDPIANRKLLLMNAKDQINIAYELGQMEENDSNNIRDEIDNSIRALGTNSFKEKVDNTISMIISIKSMYNS